MQSKIRLNKIQLFGYHGVNDDEKVNGQRFEIDIKLSYNVDKAIKTDDISMAVDYTKVYGKVIDVFSSNRYNLIEVLAHKILDSIMDNFSISKCTIIIRKPDAPIEGNLDSVEVEVMQNG